jgi:hypothetical protein
MTELDYDVFVSEGVARQRPDRLNVGPAWYCAHGLLV